MDKIAQIIVEEEVVTLVTASTQGMQGIQGEQGIQGIQGEKGDTGQGVIAGGLTNQVLAKASDNDFETEWRTIEISDATTANKGIIQLSGDLEGTADSPTITNNGVITKTLDGLNLDNADLITAQDTIISAFGKLQTQTSNNLISATDALNNKQNIFNNVGIVRSTGAGGVTYLSGTASQYIRADGAVQNLDKNAVGLENVDNTSDINKPISTATQTALNLKQNNLGYTPENTANKGQNGGYVGLSANGSINFKSINGTPLTLQSIATGAITRSITLPDQTNFTIATTADLAGKQNVFNTSGVVKSTGAGGVTYLSGTASQYIRADGTVQNLDKSAVGLGNVDNTSDVNKPISTATQTALNLKQNNIGYTPENVTNKENVTLDYNTTKYPTNNLVKIGLDLKQDLVTAPTQNNILLTNSSGQAIDSGKTFNDGGISNNDILSAEKTLTLIAGATAGNVGNAVSFYFTSINSGIYDPASGINYDLMSRENDLLEEIEQGICSGGNNSDTYGPLTFIDNYITPELGKTKINSGDWKFTFYGNVSNANKASVYVIRVYKRTNAGIETLLFEDVSDPLLLSVRANNFAYTAGEFTCNATDRISIKIYCKTILSSSVVVTFYHGGGHNNSVIQTPILIAHNQLDGLNDGDYLHLTSAQFAKATQNASSAQDGLLTKENFTLFYNKEPAISDSGTSDDYFDGAKTWQNFANKTRGILLTGLTTATNQVILATDSILQAFGKLQAQVSAKLNANTAIVAANDVTKISVDVKGLITATGNATTADINSVPDKRYVTDNQLTILNSTSGTNTGDETNASILSKLGISSISGTNTGDQNLSGLMVKASNLSDLTNVATARTNLGLGTLATQNGTFSGTSSGTNTGDQDLSGLMVKASNLSDLSDKTLAINNLFGTPTGNKFLASPNGATGNPTFRAIVANDIPTLNQNTTGNASTASKLATSITLAGNSFDGSANINFTNKFITQTTDANLPNAQALGSLSTGILKNTATTGVLSIASAGTDFQAPDNNNISTTGTTLTPNITAPRNQYGYTALASNISIGAPTGTPQNGYFLLIVLEDNGTARTITWNASYIVPSDGSLVLPTTTIVNKIHYIGCHYFNSTWNVISIL